MIKNTQIDLTAIEVDMLHRLILSKLADIKAFAKVKNIKLTEIDQYKTLKAIEEKLEVKQ